MRAKLLFWLFFLAILTVCAYSVFCQEIQQPKGYFDEIKKDGHTIIFLSSENEGSKLEQESKAFYGFIIGKVREKYTSDNLNCDFKVTAEVSEKRVGQKTYRLVWLRIDTKDNKEPPLLSMPIPESEAEIDKLLGDEQKFGKIRREEQINNSLKRLFSFLSCH